MKHFLLLLFLAAAFPTFAVHQYSTGVYWNQESETNTFWNFHLDSSFRSKYDAFGIYKLSEGLKNSAFELKEGDNLLKVTENLGFWVSSGRKTISSESFANPFYLENDYTVGITERWFDNDSYIYISQSAAPSGQPLPGVLSTMVIGGIVSGVCFARKKKLEKKSA